MEVISRKDAKARGLKYYYTGKPCRRAGHIDKRYVASESCASCMREKSLARFRNLDPVSREARREYERQRWRNDEHRKRQQAYHRRPIELEKQRERNRAYKKANRARCTDRENNRRALFLAAFVEEVSLEFLFERDKGCCQLCGDELSMDTKWPHPKTPTRDHIIPLSKGGTHERSNLQLACAYCNIAKQDRCA